MKVFVACSGVDNVPYNYRDLASEVATMLARNGHKLIFGGVDTGIPFLYTFCPGTSDRSR